MDMKDRARFLRKNQTQAEKKLWSVLRNKKFYGFKFRRQYCVSYYIADFACLKPRLIVELDGEVHLFQRDYDLERDRHLKENDFKVLRFWNHEVLNELDKVLPVIYEQLITFPSPVG